MFSKFVGKIKNARAKSSTKCGCAWRFRFTKKKGFPAIKVTTMDLNHTNGCVPSPELLRRQVVTIAWDRPG